MNIQDAAAWMIRVFVYKSDRSEEWQILHPNAKDGKLYGDCEDFSLTLLYTIADGSKVKFWFYLVTFQAVMWHCKTDWGGQHVQLWFRGKWIDNIDPTWRDKQQHSLSYPYPFPLVAYRMMTYKLSYIQSNILLVAICLIPLLWFFIK
tara:strand:+ start:453 stop:896 length:444 start_codon:yes stop_codon:yes gene_type:complete